MIGLSTSASISLGMDFVAGRKRVPRPAAGNTALRTFLFMRILSSLSARKFLHFVEREKDHRSWMQIYASECRRVIAQQCLTHNLNRCSALAHKVVVKSLQRKIRSFLLLKISAQLQNLKFAERVIQIRRVRWATFGFHCAHRPRLVAFLHEEIDTLIEGHFTGMHFD